MGVCPAEYFSAGVGLMESRAKNRGLWRNVHPGREPFSIRYLVFKMGEQNRPVRDRRLAAADTGKLVVAMGPRSLCRQFGLDGRDWCQLNSGSEGV